jgi:16S rRNA processing protein RimM
MGRLGSPHGIHGFLKVISFATPIENLLQYKGWLIRHAGEWSQYEIEKGTLHGKFLLVKFKHIHDPETARLYTNDPIAIERKDLPTIQQDEFYWGDLIGLTVINLQGHTLGTIQSLLETGSNDVWVVKGQDRDRLIPHISSVVQSIDLEHKQAVVDWDADF